MVKIDFRQDLRHLYNPSSKVAVIVDVPEMNFLMVDGMGDPNIAQEYKDAIEALYSVSYSLKFMIKKGEAAVDYGVMPLEGLWWADDMNQFSIQNKGTWKWTSMIMQPKYVTKALFHEAVTQLAGKKKLPALSKMRYTTFHEGLAAQIMHLGPYSTEGPTISILHSFIQENGYELIGKHHEIYLTDPQRSAPEKIKTVLRQPIKKTSV